MSTTDDLIQRLTNKITNEIKDQTLYNNTIALTKYNSEHVQQLETRVTKHFDHYDDVKISTQTIILNSNCNFDTDHIFENIPITKYVPLKKKRGRKKKDAPVQQEMILKPGSVISIINGKKLRGVKLTKSTKHFLNQITCTIMLDDGKKLSIKIFKNGKLHFTGCQTDKQYEDALLYLLGYMKTIYTRTGIECYKIQNAQPLHFIVCPPSMINANFKINFQIDREILATNIHRYGPFISTYDPSRHPGVDIKIYFDHVPATQSKCLVYCDDHFDVTYIQTKNPEVNKEDKPHRVSFRVYETGKINESGKNTDEMKYAYYQLLNYIIQHRETIEEKIC